MQVAMSFVEAVNARRLERISELMREDHAFVQADGSEVRGREGLRETWAAYFDLIPGRCNWQRPGISYRPSRNTPWTTKTPSAGQTP